AEHLPRRRRRREVSGDLRDGTNPTRWTRGIERLKGKSALPVGGSESCTTAISSRALRPAYQNCHGTLLSMIGQSGWHGPAGELEKRTRNICFTSRLEVTRSWP